MSEPSLHAQQKETQRTRFSLMNRKRDESEITSNENRGLEPCSKKIKAPPSPAPMSSVNLPLISNGILKSAQTTALTCPNRKRRSRNSQEILNGLLASQSTGISSATSSNGNGQLRKKTDLSCVVCTDLAHGYNFDAISCESCKAFFRRNALNNSDRLKCRRDGDCEITPETRRRCKSCRLKKCFAVGMRKEWILTEEEKTNKKRRMEENRRLRTSTSGEETTNKNAPLDLQSVLLNKEERPPLRCLTSIENSDLISSVVTAFHDGFKLDPISYGWSYPVARKITALCQILNTKNTTALRLISFYKRLHDFDTLNDMDKVNLVKSNLRYIFFFHGSLGYDPNTDVYYEENILSKKPVYGSDIREAYGVDIHIRCTLIIRELHSMAQIDQRIIQLALVIFLFSKGLANLINHNEPSLINDQQVFQIQNRYVEQLWFLMEKIYGSVRGVLMFSRLIHKCLLIQNLLRDIQQDVHERIAPEEISPIMRSVIHLT